jgi:uncharacterized lipoprotein YbaY/heat shock protein HslJ
MYRYVTVLISLVLMSMQASCGPGKTADGGGSSNIEMLEVSGQLTYRERIALPPDSIAVVELRDVSIADAPSVISDQRIELAGRQVPVPFRLIVDPAKLAGGRRYSVRGAIVGPDQQLLWTTADAHPVDPAAGDAELGALMMTRVSSQGEAAFKATGNEPGWRLDIDDRQITLLMNNGGRRVVATRSAPQTDGDTTRYASTADGQPLTATITNRVCSDNMTGMPYPNTVVVLFGGQELKGCGGDPADLLQGAEWVIEDLNGRGIVDSSRGTLNFTADGAVSGRSFCNSYSGKYTLTGETLSISMVASTLMACAPALMNQEKLFTDVMAGVRRFEIGADGDLVLHSSDGRTIRARRE